MSSELGSQSFLKMTRFSKGLNFFHADLGSVPSCPILFKTGYRVIQALSTLAELLGQPLSKNFSDAQMVNLSTG